MNFSQIRAFSFHSYSYRMRITKCVKRVDITHLEIRET